MNSTDLDVIVETLAHLICSDRDDSAAPTAAHRKYHAVARQYFDGFEIISPRLNEDEFILLARNAADLPFWPIDSCVATEGEESWPDGTWQFSRIRTLNVKDWRGKLRLYSPRMFEDVVMISQPNGAHLSVRRPYAIVGTEVRPAAGWINGHSVTGMGHELNPECFGRSRSDEDDDHVAEHLKMAAGISLRRHYLWSVLLGEGEGPRARFVTDPIGVREAFRLRDIPPGKKRRAALLHWVKEHWRKSRSRSESDRAWVRAHLRGAWSYDWNGLHCQIEPSIEDMNEAARAKTIIGRVS